MLKHLDAIAALIGKLGARPIDGWVREDEWRTGMPNAPFDQVRRTCEQLGLVARSESGRCRRCERTADEHDNDHNFETDPPSFQVDPERLATIVAEQIALLEPVSLSQPRKQLNAATYQCTGIWDKEVQFSALFHFGTDVPGLPQTDAGLPVVQINFLGAPALPEPPAVTASWIELLEEKDVRGRVHAFLLSVSDRSYYWLGDINESLGTSEVEPRGSLGRFLLGCGFELVRPETGDPNDGFEDLARLAPTMGRRFRRRPTDLIIECTCARRPGWHIHGYRDRRRTRPEIIEPRLGQWSAAAMLTSDQYRRFTASKQRLPGADIELKKDVSALAASAGGLGVVLFGDEWRYVAQNWAGPIESVAMGLSVGAALFLLIPRLLRAYYDWRLHGLKWPEAPR